MWSATTTEFIKPKKVDQWLKQHPNLELVWLPSYIKTMQGMIAKEA
jgi:hypothetical protein